MSRKENAGLPLIIRHPKGHDSVRRSHGAMTNLDEGRKFFGNQGHQKSSVETKLNYEGSFPRILVEAGALSRRGGREGFDEVGCRNRAVTPFALFLRVCP